MKQFSVTQASTCVNELGAPDVSLSPRNMLADYGWRVSMHVVLPWLNDVSSRDASRSQLAVLVPAAGTTQIAPLAAAAFGVANAWLGPSRTATGNTDDPRPRAQLAARILTLPVLQAGHGSCPRGDPARPTTAATQALVLHSLPELHLPHLGDAAEFFLRLAAGQISTHPPSSRTSTQPSLLDLPHNNQKDAQRVVAERMDLHQPRLELRSLDVVRLCSDTDVAAMVDLVRCCWAPTLRSWRVGGETLATAGLAAALEACQVLEVLDLTRAWSVVPVKLFDAINQLAAATAAGPEPQKLGQALFSVLPSPTRQAALCSTLTRLAMGRQLDAAGLRWIGTHLKALRHLEVDGAAQVDPAAWRDALTGLAHTLQSLTATACLGCLEPFLLRPLGSNRAGTAETNLDVGEDDVRLLNSCPGVPSLVSLHVDACDGAAPLGAAAVYGAAHSPMFMSSSYLLAPPHAFGATATTAGTLLADLDPVRLLEGIAHHTARTLRTLHVAVTPSRRALPASALARILPHFSGLRSLTLCRAGANHASGPLTPFDSFLDDACVAAVLQALPRLRSLDVSHCPRVRFHPDAFASCISGGSAVGALTTPVVENHCTGMRLITAPHLRALAAVGCGVDGGACTTRPRHVDCSGVAVITLVCPNLRSLNIGGNAELCDISALVVAASGQRQECATLESQVAPEGLALKRLQYLNIQRWGAKWPDGTLRAISQQAVVIA